MRPHSIVLLCPKSHTFPRPEESSSSISASDSATKAAWKLTGFFVLHIQFEDVFLITACKVIYEDQNSMCERRLIRDKQGLPIHKPLAPDFEKSLEKTVCPK